MASKILQGADLRHRFCGMRREIQIYWRYSSVVVVKFVLGRYRENNGGVVPTAVIGGCCGYPRA